MKSDEEIVERWIWNMCRRAWIEECRKRGEVSEEENVIIPIYKKINENYKATCLFSGPHL